MRLDNHFATLPDTFYTRLAAQGLTAPYWVAWSESSARLLDLPSPPDDVLLPALAGNATLPGSQPLAAVYSGHQFGSWAGQLGDGRALLLGDAAGVDGQRWELQLKGAGKTPYSRMGDGRAVLRSSIREFLCSEAMAGLGIPTTRALSIVGSDQPVIREAVETAAIVTRLSPSFVRFGNFEHFYSTGQHAELKQLADYVIERFYPSAVESAPDGPGAESDGQRPNRYAEFLRLVTDRTARLIAQWQAVGFCHGVMNTDNMSILGLTLDYGPFGFLDGFDSGHVCNHSDHQGRYAYLMQPRVGEWNCFRLGQALMPLIDSVEVAQAMLATYQRSFAEEYEARFRAKLGLRDAHSDDTDLLNRLFSILEQGRVDFTLFFRNLSAVRQADRSGDTACRDLFIDRQAFDDWAESYRQRLRSEGRDDAQRAAAMNKVNPKYVLRNHLAELAIQLARGSDELTRLRAPRGDALGGGQDEVEAGGLGSGRRGGQDFSEVARLAQVLSRPFDEQPEFEHYAALPPDWSRGLEVSCSS